MSLPDVAAGDRGTFGAGFGAALGAERGGEGGPSEGEGDCMGKETRSRGA